MLAVVLTAASGWYALRHLAVDTSTTDMLSRELPFRQDAIAMDRAFPQFDNLVVVVIDGRTADQAEDAATALAKALGEQASGSPSASPIRSVFYPQGSPFFRKHGLLYLGTDELATLIDRLAGAQAFLGKLWHDPSLRGLSDVLTLALDNTKETAPPAELARVLGAVAGAVEAQNAGRPGMVSWREILEGKDLGSADRRQTIVVQPVRDAGQSLSPYSGAMASIRATAEGIGLTPANGVTVRLTGSAALAKEELETVVVGMGLASALSFTLVLVLLFWGLRSPKLALATLATLLMGLVWTAAFAALAVGRLNLISVAFAVLFIGLSVDFGIHFALRAREGIDSGAAALDAMRRAAAGVGGALTLCAIAAAIAFYSFLPTNYVGLAELGLIAGSSMFIALLANLTVLPALIALIPPRPAQGWDPGRREVSRGRFAGAIVRHARPVAVGTVVVVVGAAALAPSLRFDFDPLNLRDPDTESMRALADLMADGTSGVYSIEILADNLDLARSLADRLKALTEVKDAVTLADYVPKDQDAKLASLDQAALFLLPALQDAPVNAPSTAERRAALERFGRALAERVNGTRDEEAAIQRLRRGLAAFDATPDALAELERRLIGSLTPRLQRLRDSLEAGPVTTDELPAEIRARMIAADGRARIEVQPRADVRDHVAMERFVTAVRTVAPRATGSPVVIVEAGRAVVRAFIEAGTISVVVIGILIAALLRRVRDVAMVFAPLVVAALLTMATAVVIGMPFNFANVIVLPLLFGLGVASAIHIVIRGRYTSDLGQLFTTSTPRAVMFSALTTIGSFGTIGLSGHPGTASMGVLLTIAIALTLAATLIVLPALMAIFGERRGP